MGSAARILDFQNVLSWASSGVIRSACISLRTQSIHLPLGLPPGLFPGTIISTIARTSLFSSILCMCPYQRSLNSLTFSFMLFTPSSFLMSTLVTLSLSCIPLILLNILISVFSRICSYFFLTVQHSPPYRSTVWSRMYILYSISVKQKTGIIELGILTKFFQNFGNSARTAITKMLLLNNTERNWSVIPSSME